MQSEVCARIALLFTGADLVGLPLYGPRGQIIDPASFKKRLFVSISDVLGKDKIVCKKRVKRFSPR